MISWRRTLYAMWVAQMLAIIGFSLRTPFLPLFLEDLGTESFEQQALWAGFITSAGAAIMAVTAPLWGAIADRYGRRMMVLRAMFAGSVTISLMALATSPWHLLGLRFIEGAMTGTVAAATTLYCNGGTSRAYGLRHGSDANGGLFRVIDRAILRWAAG